MRKPETSGRKEALGKQEERQQSRSGIFIFLYSVVHFIISFFLWNITHTLIKQVDFSFSQV